MNQNKKKNIILCIAALFLFAALMNGWPYGFFTLLRFVVFTATVYVAWMAYKQQREKWIWIFGFIAILFNPIIVIHLQREQWWVIDLIVGIFFVLSIFLVKFNNKNISIEDANDWFDNLCNYLDTVDLLRKEITNPKHAEDQFPEEDLSVQCEVVFRGPMLYMLKHSIELFLKFGIILINNGRFDSSLWHHDIKKLLVVFKHDLDNSADFTLEQSSFEKLEHIVEKYINLKEIDEVFQGMGQDKANTLVKYPNKRNFSFLYGADAEKLDERLAEVEEDIRELRVISRELKIKYEEHKK